jgi:CubicO group peptidase (beta-lactamase class C family)
MRRTTAAGACLWLLTLVAAPLARADLRTEQVDKLFEAWDHDDTPGCAIGVFHDGEQVYARGYGMADLDHGIRNTRDTAFFIGSMGKQFTVASILQLEAEGKLSLDDDVRKHIPELHDFGEPITLRHLIHHTSGLRDFLNLGLISGRSDPALDDVAWLEDKAILDLICRQRTLNFATGSEEEYSNTGYFLLGEVCERLTGQDVADYAVERLTRPLGMDHTYAVADGRQVIPNRAYGYEGDASGFRSHAVGWGAVGPAGIWSSAADLGKWAHALLNDGIGKPGTVAKTLERGTLRDGTRIDYAGGLVLGRYRGLRMVQHGGGYPGYVCNMVHFPAQGYSFVCLANAPGFDPTGKCLEMAAIYLAAEMEPAPEPAKPVETANAAPPADPGALAGEYLLDVGVAFSIEVAGDKLSLLVKGTEERAPLEHVSGTTYALREAEAEITFTLGADGKVEAITLVQRGQSIGGKPLAAVSVAASDLEALAGEYYSDELDATYRIVVEGGKLRMRTPRGDMRDLSPIADRDHWTSGASFPLQLVVKRDGAGSVTGLEIGDNARARGILFSRR